MTFTPTSAQSEAIRKTGGDLFISAGAGSGKTAVLARRFAQAIVDGGNVDGVLAITFTRKAAGEVAERVRRVLRDEIGDVDSALATQHAWVSTIHGFCSRILRRHALEAGLAPGFRVLDPTEAGLMQEASFEDAAAKMWAEEGMRELVARFGAGSTREIVLRLHGRLRSLGRSPEDLPEMKAAPLGPVIVAAHAAVEDALVAHPSPPKNATQAANVLSLRAAREGLLAAGKLPSAQQAVAALEVTEACTLRLRCPSTKEKVRAAREALEDVASAVLDTEVMRHARMLKRLLASFATEYREAKDRDGALDQDDLQECVERLFRDRPEVAKAYARQFAMIMVDEFQDTNELQVGVIEPLRRDDLCVVGDERQAIYSFRDADVEVFRRMRSTIHERVSLDTNFRSHPALLRFVNAVFSSEALFGPSYEPLLPPEGVAEDEEEAPRAEVLLVEREGWPERRWREAEASALAARLAELVREGTASPGEIVVLLRAFTNSAPYIAALEAAGLPAVAAGGGSFSLQPAIIELESLLAAAALPYDEESLATVLLGGLADLGGGTLLRLHALSKERRGLWAALEAASDGEWGAPEASDSEGAKLRAVRDAIALIRTQTQRRGLSDALTGACSVLGVRERLLARGRAGERSWANVRKLIRMADTFSAESGDDPGAFADHLRALRRLGGTGQAPPRTDDAVRVMTVHAAKGLEFPVVAVADLGRELNDPHDLVFLHASPAEGVRWALRLPDSPNGEQKHKPRAWTSMHDEEALRQHAEEKRLLYVACTRAERRLIVSGVSALDAPEQGTPAAWVREALGLTEHAGKPGVRETGDAAWLLRLVRPDEAHEPTRPLEPERSTAPPADGEARRGDPVRPNRPAAQDREAPSTLSFSALKLFGSCPYRFYAQHVLGLRRAARPVNAALDFGNALHAVLEGAGELTKPPSCDRLTAIARAYHLDEGEAARLARAAANFAGTAVAARAANGDRVAREVPFAIPIAGTRLAGAMDLVSWSGEDALVVDYKTGRELRGDALAQHYGLQAECYALALLQAGAARVEVAFVAVELDGETVALSFSPEDAPALRRKLEALAGAACQGPYEPRDRYEFETCEGCVVLGGLCGVTPPPHRSRGAA